MLRHSRPRRRSGLSRARLAPALARDFAAAGFAAAELAPAFAVVAFAAAGFAAAGVERSHAQQSAARRVERSSARNLESVIGVPRALHLLRAALQDPLQIHDRILVRY